MSALVDQLPALVGVVIGAAGSYVTLHFAERARWRRELAVRWDQDRLRAYTEYSDAVKAMFHVLVRIAASRGASTLGEPLVPELGWPEFTQAEERRALAWEAVLMLGDQETIRAGRVLHESVWTLERIIRQESIPADQWEVARANAATARDRFYACARTSLGVTSSGATAAS